MRAGEPRQSALKGSSMSQLHPPVSANMPYVEEVELQGHILDSLLLPKVLDEILTRGGSYEMKDIQIGQRQTDPSFARIQIRAPSNTALQEILDAIHDHGAISPAAHDCTTV